MQSIVIIPARYASQRLPGKPLLDICGKPMLQRVYEQATKSKAQRVIIATDNNEIEQVMSAMGFEVCMTSQTHRSGTDRLSEVITQLNLPNDAVIVNVQGDEPLIPPETINQVADLLIDNPNAQMSTLSTPIENKSSLIDPNVVKVVVNRRGEALYFSRSVIPHHRGAQTDQTINGIYQRHIGIYAYRAEFIQKYSRWPTCELEKIESLEQLRVLWQGEIIQVAQAVKVPAEGVDTQADLDKVRLVVESQGCDSLNE